MSFKYLSKKYFFESFNNSHIFPLSQISPSILKKLVCILWSQSQQYFEKQISFILLSCSFCFDIYESQKTSPSTRHGQDHTFNI